jgi:hypothetical protein
VGSPAYKKERSFRLVRKQKEIKKQGIRIYSVSLSKYAGSV